MLSQHCKDVKIGYSEIYQGRQLYDVRYRDNSHEESSCLYVGDADLKKMANLQEVEKFWTQNIVEKNLLLMQIPHHGSSSNSNDELLNRFKAHFYFVNDKDSLRIQKNKTLFSLLAKNEQLMMCRGNQQDIVFTCAYM